jgi:putative inorganic carbon (HCO3(-)) transporter
VSATYVPIAAVVAAAGAGLLLVERDARQRLLGIAAFAAGVVPLGIGRVNGSAEIAHSHAVVAVLAMAAAGAFAVLTLVALRWPFVVPLAAGLLALRPVLHDPPRPIDHLAPMFLVLLAGLLALAIRTVRGGAESPELGLTGWALAAFTLWVAVTSAWTGDTDQASFDLVSGYLPLAVIASLTARCAGDLRFRRATPAVQVAAAVAFALVAVYQHFARVVYTNHKLELSNAYSSLFRVNSIFYDPSLFGRFEVLALITIVGACLFAAPSRRIVVGACLAPVIFAAVVFTYSQTSFAALIAGIAVLIAAAWRKLAALAAAAAVLVVVVGVAISQPQVMKVLHKSVNKASSSRVELAERGGRTFLDHPVFGVGVGGFAQATGKTALERASIAPHNVVIGVAAETGVVGLCLFAVVVACIVRSVRRVPDRPWRVVLAATLVALAVHALAYAQLFTDPTAWIAASLAASLAALPAAEPAGEASAAVSVVPAEAAT